MMIGCEWKPQIGKDGLYFFCGLFTNGKVTQRTMMLANVLTTESTGRVYLIGSERTYALADFDGYWYGPLRWPVEPVPKGA